MRSIGSDKGSRGPTSSSANKADSADKATSGMRRNSSIKSFGSTQELSRKPLLSPKSSLEIQADGRDRSTSGMRRNSSTKSFGSTQDLSRKLSLSPKSSLEIQADGRDRSTSRLQRSNSVKSFDSTQELSRKPSLSPKSSLENRTDGRDRSTRRLRRSNSVKSFGSTEDISRKPSLSPKSSLENQAEGKDMSTSGLERRNAVKYSGSTQEVSRKPSLPPKSSLENQTEGKGMSTSGLRRSNSVKSFGSSQELSRKSSHRSSSGSVTSTKGMSGSGDRRTENSNGSTRDPLPLPSLEHKSDGDDDSLERWWNNGSVFPKNTNLYKVLYPSSSSSDSLSDGMTMSKDGIRRSRCSSSSSVKSSDSAQSLTGKPSAHHKLRTHSNDYEDLPPKSILEIQANGTGMSTSGMRRSNSVKSFGSTDELSRKPSLPQKVRTSRDESDLDGLIREMYDELLPGKKVLSLETETDVADMTATGMRRKSSVKSFGSTQELSRKPSLSRKSSLETEADVADMTANKMRRNSSVKSFGSTQELSRKPSLSRKSSLKIQADGTDKAASGMRRNSSVQSLDSTQKVDSKPPPPRYTGARPKKPKTVLPLDTSSITTTLYHPLSVEREPSFGGITGNSRETFNIIGNSYRNNTRLPPELEIPFSSDEWVCSRYYLAR